MDLKEISAVSGQPGLFKFVAQSPNGVIVEAVATGTDAEFEEIRKYIRFVDGQILLGEVGNELELQIANDRISFLQDGAEVAYFSNRKLYVTDTQILHSLQLGSFAFMPRANGNLSFKKVT